MKRLVFATNNAHKLAELRQLIGDRFEVLSLSDIGCHADIPETADTLEGNAVIKARYVVDNYGIDCFSDDTGLEIDALGGEPGVRSARYAGDEHDSERNIDKVLRLLEGVTPEQRTAHFRTVVCLIIHGEQHLFEGRVDGHILLERHGNGGFGYDAVFEPVETPGISFAQMEPQQKNAVSHRGRAVAQLIEFLRRTSL